MKASEKLKDRTRTYQYRNFLKQMNKAADDGKNSICVIKLLPHTQQILESEGFIIEGVEYYNLKQQKYHGK